MTPPHTRTQLLDLYEQLRGALHSRSNWNDSSDIHLTFIPTCCGFTGREQAALFCSNYPINPLNHDYINRFNNACTRAAITVDVEGGSVSEVLLLRTMFQPPWKWMLPHGNAPVSSITLVVHLNASIMNNKLHTVLVNWDHLSLLNQLGLLPASKFEHPSAAKTTARLLHPTPGNTQTQFESIHPSIPKGHHHLSMSELLTDLPPPTPKQPPRVVINPAMVSKGEALFVTHQEGSPTTTSDALPGRSNPAMASKVILGDGADQKPTPSPTSLKSTNPMGTLLDQHVAPLPSRGVNEKFHRELFGDLGQELEQRPGRIDTSGRFSSSVFAMDKSEDVPIQSVAPSTGDKLLANSTRFSSSIFDDAPLPHYHQSSSLSMQSANNTRFTSHLLSPSELLEGERKQRQSASTTNVLRGSTIWTRLPVTYPPPPLVAHPITIASQISFDYYTEEK